MKSLSLSLSFLHPLQGVITDEEKSSGYLISAHSDAAALTSTMRFTAKKLHAGNWRHASNKKEPFTASRLVPALAWYLATRITTHSMAYSITSRVPAPTCWLGPAGRWQGCHSSAWRPKMRTVESPLFRGSEMLRWRCMVTESCYQKAVLEQSRWEFVHPWRSGLDLDTMFDVCMLLGCCDAKVLQFIFPDIQVQVDDLEHILTGLPW